MGKQCPFKNHFAFKCYCFLALPKESEEGSGFGEREKERMGAWAVFLHCNLLLFPSYPSHFSIACLTDWILHLVGSCLTCSFLYSIGLVQSLVTVGAPWQVFPLCLWNEQKEERTDRRIEG